MAARPANCAERQNPVVGSRMRNCPVVGQSVLTFWHGIQDFLNTWKRLQYIKRTLFFGLALAFQKRGRGFCQYI